MKKKDFPLLSGWDSDAPKNYELEYLRMENLKLKEDNELLSKNKIDINMEKDIAALLQLSMKMKYLLEQCRFQSMLPLDLGKQIDRVLKEIETYG